MPEEFTSATTEARIAALYSVKTYHGGRVIIHLSLPEEKGNASIIAGTEGFFSGKRTVEADQNDNPSWESILEPSRAAVYMATHQRATGRRRISFTTPKMNENTCFYEGTVNAVTGYKVVGADLSDLNPSIRHTRRFHVGAAHVWTMAIG